MLCPEVFNFKTPSSEFRVESGNFEDSFVERNIKGFHFNHLVSLTVPGTLKIPQSLTSILSEDSDYYRVDDFNLSDLIEETFHAAFIKQGNLTVLSINTNIDTENCFCVTPNKSLVLSLEKETYQSLGINGTVSHFCKRNKYKYIIVISLLDIATNSNYYKKLKSALKCLTFNIILNWEPPTMSICPSSIAKYLYDAQYSVKSCSTTEKNHFLSPNVPNIDFENCHLNDALEYWEWLGMVALEADFDGSVSSYTNTYDVPEPSSSMGPVKYLQWRGFFSSKRVYEFFLGLREYIQKEQDVPWVAMNVQGFTDSVVAWGERENNFFVNADNSYVYFVSSKEYICCTLKTSYKEYINKY